MQADPFRMAADHMEGLAEDNFGELYPAKKTLVRKAVTPEAAVCGPSPDWNNPANDPELSQAWERNREVRAQIIRWLCVDREAKLSCEPSRNSVVGGSVSLATSVSTDCTGEP